ncbi:MAG TPA: zinc ribbon domain-containing protein [Candidatus Paceibacterota bacterium]|nr:zinc ribbon domain-containing protein [Candidatus Paceibacterota bacterium]
MRETSVALDAPQSASPQNICPYCHQPILPTYYFCPNCGVKLSEAHLSTSISTQIMIYAFSIILPSLCYLLISKWPGWKYYKSKEAKVHQIGIVAITLLVLSSIVTFWLIYVWITDAIQSSLNGLNTDLNGY